MSLSDDLKAEVAQIFREPWGDVIDGRVVPEPDNVPFGNRGVELDGTVLYADLAESTALVDRSTSKFAAEVYKTYLHCAGKIIRAEDGVITAYDGDRVMAVFLGEFKRNSATRAALRLDYARTQIINPALAKQYPDVEYRVKHVIGIAAGKLLATRVGVRGANDLVWVGSAANHAAKLTALSSDFPVWITKPVYDVLKANIKKDGMWEPRTWTAMGEQRIYRTKWHLEL
jgi:class 3 adenylate cyclase